MAITDAAAGLPVRSEADPDQRVHVKVVDSTTPANMMKVTAGNKATVLAYGLSGATETALKLDPSGALYTVATDALAGVEVVDFAIGTAIATGAATTHSYTAINTMRLQAIWASSSGKIRVELKVGPAATLATKGVFYNSVSNPNVIVPIMPDIEVVTGNLVQLVITNLEKTGTAAFDISSTILGVDY